MIVVPGADTWCCLRWVDVLFLVFCCPLWVLRDCGGSALPGRECSWGLDRCGHWASRENVCRYWELTLRNGKGLEVVESPWAGRKEDVFQHLLSPQE